MRSRTAALAAVMVGCLLAAAGCAQIPDSGPVRAGYRVDTQQEPALIQFQPDGPHRGDSPAQVVEGFLAAMQAYPPSSAVASRFLTSDAVAGWEPRASTLVYRDAASTALRGGRVKTTLTSLGALSERGTWSSAPYGGGDVSYHFRLQRVGRQWRIANPPRGSLVSQAYFERYYRPYSLYFFDRSRSILVPDPVYLPDGTQTPTLLIQGLLHGPTRFLAGAVDSLLPVSTQVDLSVPVSAGGTATVPLNEAVFALDPEERQLLLAQVSWTLGQVAGIRGVRITVDGAPLEIAGSRQVAPVDTLPSFDPAGLVSSRQLYGLRGDRLVSVNGSKIQPVAGPLGAGRLSVATPAVAVDGQRAAVVSANGRKVYVSGIEAGAASAPREPARWYTGTRLLRPSWDRTGRLWMVNRTKEGAKVVVAEGSRSSNDVAVPGVTGRDVQALSVSRDGVRLAAVVATRQGPRLLVARINRSRSGAVSAVDHVWEVTSPTVRFGTIADVAWDSPTALVVLARSAKSSLQPYVVSIDGSSVTESTALPGVGVTSVAAAPNPELPIVLGTSSGRLYIRRVDLRWTRLGDDRPVMSPVYPG